MCVQSLASKRVVALREIRLPDVKREKTADMKLNVLSVGLNTLEKIQDGGHPHLKFIDIFFKS